MRKFFQILFAVALAGMMASCVTQKQMTYLANATPDMTDSINANFHSKTEAVIRTGDALTISVSALDLEAVAPYNLPTAVFSAPGMTQLSTTAALQYYTVDEDGNIDFPVLGNLHVAGLKRNEVEQMLRERLEQQVVNPNVHVNLVNAKVSVLGEVNKPGQIPMTSGRITLLDALAAAGDMTPYGRRDNVLVTREVNGKIEIARLNMRSADLYTSPYYFLQQNDVVYVSPNKVRAVSSANASLWFSLISTLASTATVIVTVVNAIK